MPNVTIPSIITNPYKAVSFVQSSIEKALEKAGSLIAEIKYDGLRGNLLAQPLEGLQAKCEVLVVPLRFFRLSLSLTMSALSGGVSSSISQSTLRA